MGYMDLWAVFAFVENTSLLERLLGVGVYVVLLLLACLAINQTRNQKQVYIILFSYQIILTGLAFCFVFNEHHDLSRLLQIVESLRGMAPDDFVGEVLLGSSSPATYVLYYITAASGLDGLLPASAAFIFYGCIFYIIGKTNSIYNLPPQATSLCLFFFMCSGTFLEVISDIRNLVAFSIIACCAFREMAEGKSILASMPFYVIALMIHLAALPLIALRLIFLVFFEKNSFLAKVGSIAFVVVVLSLLLLFAGSFVEKVYLKALSYITVRHYSYFWEYLAGALKYILCIYIYVFCRRHVGMSAPEGLRRVAGFAFMVWTVGVAFCFEYSIFHRFMVPMMVLMVPALGFAATQLDGASQACFRRNVLAVSVLILLIACVRGDLCSYRFLAL